MFCFFFFFFVLVPKVMNRFFSLAAVGTCSFLLRPKKLNMSCSTCTTASDERFGRRWLEATIERLEPDAAVVSWWSFSTPLWYGRWVEGRRPDLLIIDDRDLLDDGYGTASAAIDRFLPERPVYLIRLERDLPAFVERYLLERVEGIPSPGDVYRVVGRREGVAPTPAPTPLDA